MNINCPSCGAQVPVQIKYTKLVVCPHCRMTLFLEDAAVAQAGAMSVLVETKPALTLGQPFYYSKKTFVPVGRIRYDYGHGFWDEWWGTSSDGEQYWVSIDEGDISLQKKVELLPLAIPDFAELQIGQVIVLGSQELEVTEKNTCRCVYWEGELPFQITQEEKIDFVDLSAAPDLVYTLEYFPDGIQCFKGQWLSPTDMKDNR